MPNPENIEKHKMQKGTTLNPNGRPRKFVTLLKDQGYKRSEINDTIQAMLSMDMNELKGVYDDPRATILEKTVANALRKSLEKGTLYSIETLLTRVFGQPKQEVTQTIIERPIFNGINLDVTTDDGTEKDSEAE
jgi:hypothetical protein